MPSFSSAGEMVNRVPSMDWLLSRAEIMVLKGPYSAARSIASGFTSLPYRKIAFMAIRPLDTPPHFVILVVVSILNNKNKYMRKSYKIVTGIATVVVVAALALGNSGLYKGSLGDLVNGSPAVGTLTVSRDTDTDTNVKTSQIVSGTSQVTFGAYKFQTGTGEDIRIKKITVKNIGSNMNGIANIGIYYFNGIAGKSLLLNDAPATPANEGIMAPSLKNNEYTFDYSTRPYTIPANSFLVLQVIADTVYQATSGQTVQFEITSVEAEGAVSNAPIVFTGSAKDNPKTLYPTKLNFSWLHSPAGDILTTGKAVEVARFTLGADAADPFNPGATLSVTDLNFTLLATARLTRLMIYDVTNNIPVTPTNGSNSTNFMGAGTTEFNNLYPLLFQQGEKRTFKIIADVGTNAGSQTAQFRFNSGTPFTPGTATWNVTNNGITSYSSWTELQGNDSDTSSPTLASSSTASDITAPKINSIKVRNGNITGKLDSGDSITITFDESIDPDTIKAGLHFGATAMNVDSRSTGGLTATTNALGDIVNVRVEGIMQFNIKSTSPLVPKDAVIKDMVTVDLDGRTLTIRVSEVQSKLVLSPLFIPPFKPASRKDSWLNAPFRNLIPSQTIDAPATILGNILRDTSGNVHVPGTGPIPTGSF